MILRTVYVDVTTLNYLYSILDGSLKVDFDSDVYRRVSFKRTGKFPNEVQVPLQAVSKFSQDDTSTISMYEIQKLHPTS